MIRKAEQKDAERIAEIVVNGWRTAYITLMDEAFLFKNLSVIKRWETLKEQLEGEHNYYVYEANDIVKGFMYVGDCAEAGETGDALELVAIYIEPIFKRNGIGQALIEYCEALAQQKGKPEIRLWVLEGNAPSRAFYEKQGFKDTGFTKIHERLQLSEVRYVKPVNL